MGTVVSKDVPALAIIGNPPPCVLKERNPDHYQILDESMAYSGMSGFER
jgi:hypothetical protein